MVLIERTVSAVRQFLVNPFTKLMAYILLFVIAIDIFWGGVFAGFAGNVLGVVVAGYSVVQFMVSLMKLPANRSGGREE